MRIVIPLLLLFTLTVACAGEPITATPTLTPTGQPAAVPTFRVASPTAVTAPAALQADEAEVRTLIERYLSASFGGNSDAAWSLLCTSLQATIGRSDFDASMRALAALGAVLTSLGIESMNLAGDAGQVKYEAGFQARARPLSIKETDAVRKENGAWCIERQLSTQ